MITFAIAHSFKRSSLAQIREQLAENASAPIDKDYAGPALPSDGLPTLEFVESLIDWFKSGKVLPRRIAWQIVLGAQEQLEKEATLVDVRIPEGETINVYARISLHPAVVTPLTRFMPQDWRYSWTILRFPASTLADGETIANTYSTFQR